MMSVTRRSLSGPFESVANGCYGGTFSGIGGKMQAVSRRPDAVAVRPGASERQPLARQSLLKCGPQPVIHRCSGLRTALAFRLWDKTPCRCAHQKARGVATCHTHCCVANVMLNCLPPPKPPDITDHHVQLISRSAIRFPGWLAAGMQ